VTDGRLALERGEGAAERSARLSVSCLGDWGVGIINRCTTTFCILILCAVFAIRFGAPVHARAQAPYVVELTFII